jgi:hypothetical protein
LLLLCRPGFEAECMAEAGSSAAAPASGTGWICVEGDAAARLALRPFRSLVFARDRSLGQRFSIADPSDRVGPLLARAAAWAFIVWEGVFPLVLFKPDWVWLFGGVALLFHFLVFWFFGLNRFFWAWATNLSSVFFLSHWLGSQ